MGIRSERCELIWEGAAKALGLGANPIQERTMISALWALAIGFSLLLFSQFTDRLGEEG